MVLGDGWDVRRSGGVIIDVKNEAGTCGNLSTLAVPVIDGLHCFLTNLLVNLPLE